MDEQVDAAVAFDGTANELVYFGGPGDVGRNGFGAMTETGGKVVERVGVARRKDDRRAGGDQCLGRRAADSAACAGDDGNFSGE